MRLLTIAVLQPIVSPLLSISCRLITPYIRPFWFKNDGTVVTLARTAFDASCAAIVPQFLSARSGLVFRQLPKLCARELHKLVRRHARPCAPQWFGWATNVFDYRSYGAALCWALSHQHWWAHPLSIVVPHAVAVAEPCTCTSARRVER